jgi:hypothetical protein
MYHSHSLFGRGNPMEFFLSYSCDGHFPRVIVEPDIELPLGIPACTRVWELETKHNS